MVSISFIICILWSATEGVRLLTNRCSMYQIVWCCGPYSLNRFEHYNVMWRDNGKTNNYSLSWTQLFVAFYTSIHHTHTCTSASAISIILMEYIMHSSLYGHYFHNAKWGYHWGKNDTIFQKDSLKFGLCSQCYKRKVETCIPGKDGYNFSTSHVRHCLKSRIRCQWDVIYHQYCNVKVKLLKTWQVNFCQFYCQVTQVNFCKKLYFWYYSRKKTKQKSPE